jgi:hypothetical protein
MFVKQTRKSMSLNLTSAGEVINKSPKLWFSLFIVALTAILIAVGILVVGGYEVTSPNINITKFNKKSLPSIAQINFLKSKIDSIITHGIFPKQYQLIQSGSRATDEYLKNSDLIIQLTYIRYIDLGNAEKHLNLGLDISQELITTHTKINTLALSFK